MIIRSTLGRVHTPSLPSSALIKKAVLTSLKSERKALRGDVNVVFTDIPRIKKLNKMFLNEKGSTDVIAFPFKAPPGVPERDFGDIYICVPEARQNARKFGEDIKRELIRLVVHGVLHILGYDDHDPREKKIMWKKQEVLVNRLCPTKKS